MPLDLSRIRALCFDVDGTLSDTDDYYVSRLALWLRRLPLIHDPERRARRIVMSLESPANILMGLADRLSIDDQVVGVIDWLYRHDRRPARPLPSIAGVPRMLDQLRRRYPMAVVSTRAEGSTLSFLDHAGLRPHFRLVVTALSAPRTKPFPDPIILAAREMGVSPQACVMIGDTTIDIRAGKAAGAQTVGVLCGFGEQDELRRSGADLILQTTSDLGAALLGS